MWERNNMKQNPRRRPVVFSIVDMRFFLSFVGIDSGFCLNFLKVIAAIHGEETFFSKGFNLSEKKRKKKIIFLLKDMNRKFKN